MCIHVIFLAFGYNPKTELIKPETDVWLSPLCFSEQHLPLQPKRVLRVFCFLGFGSKSVGRGEQDTRLDFVLVQAWLQRGAAGSRLSVVNFNYLAAS